MKSSIKSAPKSSSSPTGRRPLSGSGPQGLRALCCMLLGVSGGCSKPSTPAPPPTPAVAVRPAPVSALKSKQVGSVERLPLDSYPRFAFLPRDRRPGIIFVNSERDNGVSPSIVIVREGRYEVVELADERFENHGWVQGYASSDHHHFWAITDSVVESPSWELHIVHSADGGTTWVAAEPLRKPYYLAAFHTLRMRPDGSGELILLHQDDASNPISNVPAGYYAYATRDWGNSWSAPVHIPDILQGPDSVPNTSRTDRVPLSVYLQDFQ